MQVRHISTNSRPFGQLLQNSNKLLLCPQLKKWGGILVSACPYVCMYAGLDPEMLLLGGGESGSFRPWVVSAWVVSAWVVSAWVVSAQFWGGSFRPRKVGRFGPGSFRPKSIPKCRLLRTGRQTNR